MEAGEEQFEQWSEPDHNKNTIALPVGMMAPNKICPAT
jgi:hypothetical protein